MNCFPNEQKNINYVDYNMFNTVQYSVTDNISTDDIVSILFTRLLVKGVRGSISMNRIRKNVPVLPTHNTSIIPGLEKNNTMSVSTDKNEFVVSRVDIIRSRYNYISYSII